MDNHHSKSNHPSGEILDAIEQPLAEFVGWNPLKNCPVILVYENVASHRKYKDVVARKICTKINLRKPPEKKFLHSKPKTLTEEEKLKLEAAENALPKIVLPSLPIHFAPKRKKHLQIHQQNYKLEDEGCDNIALVTALIITSPILKS